MVHFLKEENIQHPTSNAQPRTSNGRTQDSRHLLLPGRAAVIWMLRVGCSMLDVLNLKVCAQIREQTALRRLLPVYGAFDKIQIQHRLYFGRLPPQDSSGRAMD